MIVVIVMFLAFPRPQNILGTIIISETPADFAACLNSTLLLLLAA